jgi:hypothetical protein
MDSPIRGAWTRVTLAFAAFFTILFQGRLPSAIRPDTGPTPGSVREDGQADRAVQMLALLQREGRLIDFLMEDLGTYSDAQIGAAARDVHDGCRRAIERYLTLEAVLGAREGEPVTLTDTVDPITVKLVGNVTGRPPLTGTLLHRGWRAVRVELPPLSPPAGRAVVAQAEVEV